MNILGLNYFFHDSTACLLVDGRMAAVIEEERLTRNKHTGAFPEKAIQRCLEMYNLKPSDIDAVAVSIKPSKDWFACPCCGAEVARGTSFCDGVRTADDVLRQAVQGISDIITTPGLINRDFSDIKATMLGMGFAMILERR